MNNGHVLRQAVGHAIHFAEQNRRGIHRIARRINRGFNGADGGVVHHLQRGGDNAGGHNAGHRPSRSIHGGEVGEHSVHGVGERHQAHRDFRGHTEAAFAAHKQPEQVVPVRFTEGVAQLRDGAIGEDHLTRHDVIERHAIFETVRPAGILGHIAADGAHTLAGRVGRVLQAEGGHGA